MNRCRWPCMPLTVLAVAMVSLALGCAASSGQTEPPAPTTLPAARDGAAAPFSDLYAPASPPPAQGAPTGETLIGCDPVTGRAQEVNLCWEQLCVASGYDIEVAKDADFSTKVIDWVPRCDFNSKDFFAPERVTAPCAFIPAGGTIASSGNAGSALAVTLNGYLECGHTYYWRVQARLSATGEVARSPWSDTKSFTIKAGLPVSTPYFGPQLLAPNNGSVGWPARFVSFSWSPFSDTTSYKFQLAKDAAMTETVQEATVYGTAYEYNGTLDYGTNYFWRVMALEPVQSDWSAVFSFQTQAAPAPPPPAAKGPAIPLWIWAIIGVGAILLIAVLVLIMRTRRT